MKACTFARVVAAIMLADAVASASILLPPEPPAGWQERQTPGFEPSVESVLADTHEKRIVAFGEEPARELWEGWGPGATEVLFELLNSPEWEGFRPGINELIFLSPYPETHTRIEQELFRIAENSEFTRADRRRLHEFLPLFRWRQRNVMPVLLRLAQSPHPDVIEATISTLSLLHSDESLAAARTAILRLPEERRALSKARIKDGDAWRRADEPMAPAPENDPAAAKTEKSARRKKSTRKERLRLQEGFLHPSRWYAEPANSGHPTEELVKMAHGRGGKAVVKFFAKTAANEEVYSDVRRKALMALGRIGTEESVAAFKALRDAARALPGAPQSKEAYTHAERMYEALLFTVYVIPGLGETYPRRSRPGGWVSEDYARGTTGTGDLSAECRRYGDEWLIVSALPLPPL